MHTGQLNTLTNLTFLNLWSEAWVVYSRQENPDDVEGMKTSIAIKFTMGGKSLSDVFDS